MNVCVTLNPCLDKSLVVPPWEPGEHQVRGSAFQQVVGGKGVNVARGLSQLGRETRPALFLGGELGRLCERLLIEQDRLDPWITWTAAPTREVFTVRTGDTADQTAFFDPNPTILPTECDEFVVQVTKSFAQRPAWCAFCGSSPCSTADAVYATLIPLARAAGVRTLVDTYGDCLIPALEAGPNVVKMNCRECEQAVGFSIDSATSLRDALQWIRSFGVAYAAITFGSRGMAASWDTSLGAWKPPGNVRVVNPIGAGDAISAGLIDGLTRGDAPDRASLWAMACAVSSVQRWIACDVDRADTERMVSRVEGCELHEVVG